MESASVIKNTFYSRLCSQIQDGMRDMFRTLAYDVTAFMKAAQDLDDEHALDQGQWQVTAKAASAGGSGDPSSGPEVSAKPLSEAR